MNAQSQLLNRGPRIASPAKFLVAALLILFAMSPARAADDDREMERARKHVQEIIRKAQDLRSHGDLEGARDAMREAMRVRQEVRRNQMHREGREQRERVGRDRHDDPREELIHVIEGLKHGVEALQHIGRHDEAERLIDICHEVSRKLEHVEREMDEGQRHRDHGMDEEREHRDRDMDEERHHLDVARTAVMAFRKTERHEDGKRLQHAIKAHELELEGRDDERARRYRDEAPDIEEVIHLLHEASGIWEEWGREHEAHALRELAEFIHREVRDDHDRDHEHDGNHGHDDGHEHDDGPDRQWDDPRFHETFERLERLEHQVERMTRAFEQIRKRLERGNMQRQRG